MAINTDIWGTDWQNPWHYCAKMTRDTMWQYVVNGIITLNDLPDPSGCYCAMDSNNPFINAFVIKPDKSTVPLFKKSDTVYNWFFMQNSADPTGDPYSMEFSNTTGDLYNKWAHWTSTSQLQYYYTEYSNKFLFNIKLNKLLFIPMIQAGAAGTYNENTETFTLANYVETGHTNYPYIHSVYMDIYYNDSETDVPHWTAARGSDRYYEFFSLLAELSDDFRALRPNLETLISTFCLFTTSGTGESHTRYYIPLMGFGYSSRRTLSYYPISFDPDMTHYVYNNNDNPSYIQYSVQYSTEYIQFLYRTIAYFGVFFLAEGSGDFTNVNLFSDRVYCGTIEEDGITRGNYTKGIRNLLQPQYGWEDTSESTYDPSNPPKVDPNNYSVGMHNNYPWISSPNRLYTINSTHIGAITGLYNSLWECYYTNDVGTADGQKPPTEFNYDEFLTISPIDTIVSLKLFPYDTKASSTAVAVRLGKYNTRIGAYTADKMKILDFGTVNIFGYFGKSVKGDWRDRETKYTLFAPFCGVLELDPAFYMGKDIGLEYHIDQITGACTAIVSITDDNGVKVYTDTISGVCAVDVPITGLDQATIQSQIFNANQQLKLANINAATGLINSALQIGGAAVEGDAATAATAAISGISGFIKNNAAVESAQYNLTHTHTIPRQIGAASPLCSMLSDWLPRIIISQPIDGLSEDKQKEFAESKGFACIIPDKIGERTGFIQMTNVKITPPANATVPMTQAEADMIKSLLAGGIYV